MSGLFDVKRCRECGQPIQLVPLLGWVHVNVLDNIDCEARA